MAQFDVYPNPSQASRQQYPYLVDIQSPYLETLATRIVIPLARASAFGNKGMKRLTPEIDFNGEALLLMTPQLSSIPSKILGKPIGTMTHLRAEITGALDFAILGV